MKILAKLALIFVASLIVKLGVAFEDKDVVAMWLFDDIKGNVVRDTNPVGKKLNNGKIFGAKWAEGHVKSGLGFPGNQKPNKGVYVEVPSSDALNVEGDQITVQAWVKPMEIHKRDTCLNSVAQKWGDVSARRQYQLALCGKGGGQAWFYVSTDGASWPRVEGQTPIKNEKWTHISGTYDGKFIKIYVNGVLDAEVKQTGDLHTSDIYVRIGGYGLDKEYKNNRFYYGDIDEVMIAKKALTPGEIKETMDGLRLFFAVHPASKITTTWGRIKNL